MEFIDLKAQQLQKLPDGMVLKDKIMENIEKVLKHGKYILGPEVSELEEKLKKYIKIKHCIACSSGTDALLISLMALGIKPGDEIITTPFSFFASSETILLLGAIPVFADIDPRTYNIDPKEIEKLITPKTKAILAVSLYGQTANFTKLNQIADYYRLHVIEDAAQSFGAIHNQRKSCNLSTIGTTSFFPSKPLGGYGDGGACFTDNDELAKKLRSISLHGQLKRYQHEEIGINGRLDTLQAAIILAKLPILEKEIISRNEIAKSYNSKLNSLGFHGIPHIENGNTSVFAQYTIRVKNRDEVIKSLKKSGIPSAVHYPIPLYNQSALTNKYNDIKNRNCKNTQTVSNEVISLPMHPYLTEDKIDKVVSSLESTFKTI